MVIIPVSAQPLEPMPQQLDIAHSVTDRPLKNLSDEMLQLLVENARQLEEVSGVVIDGDGQVLD